VEFITGSTRNGSIAANIHQFTGSILASGSIQFSNSATITTNAGTGFLAMYANGGGLYFGGAASTNQMMISSSGNIGIGTTTPGNRLSILGADETVNPTLGTNAGKFGIFNGVGAGTYGMIMGVINNGNSYIQVQRIDATATAYNLLLQPSGGSVGIGIATANPTAKLEVSDATNAIIKVNATSDGAQAALSLNGYASGGVYRASRLNFQQAGTNKWSILQDYNQDNTNSLTFEQAGTRRVVFDASGNVGIGTNTPGAKLDVSGNIKFNNIVSTDYSISFSGIGAGAWYNIPEVNLNGFYGLATISIQNNNASYGYTVKASAWIFQTGINGDNIYSGLRSVTIRPDGVSQEGINVVESYHTAPTSGRYNIRMRLRVRDAGLSAENPLNLQIWVDSTTSFPASGTLSLKAI
jgi:hypothetical protein